MLRLMVLITVIRLLGFFYVLQYETITGDFSVELTLMTQEGHHCTGVVSSLNGQPMVLTHHMHFYCQAPMILRGIYEVEVSVQTHDDHQLKSWYQNMWHRTHHSVKLLNQPKLKQIQKKSFRAHLVDRFNKKIPNHELKPIVQSLLWGDRGALSDEIASVFIQTGTMHLLAISGLHVACVVGAIMALGGSSILAVSMGWVYVLFALAPPSAIRAMLMATLILLCPELGWIYVFLLTLFIHLMLFPMDSISISTVLSYWAIIMIRFIVVFARDCQWAFPILLSILMLPISLFFFHQWPIASIWLNIIAVPWFSCVILPLSAIALMLSLLGLPGLWSSVYASMSWMIKLLLLFESWPKIYAFDHVWLTAVLIQVGLMVYIVKRPKWPYVISLLLIGYCLIHHPLRVSKGKFCLVMLDVGQGLSIWIKTQHHAVLYDVGTEAAGRKVVLPFISSQGLNQLSHIIISHWDQDHVGGLNAIQPKTKAKLITSDPKLGEPCLYGKSFELDGVSFNFYHPTQKRHKSKNKNSCVLLVSNHKHSAILLGDIDQQDEKKLVSRLWGQSVDLMVAAHHGSQGSNGYPLLYTLHPKIIWVSAGRHNPYHHPHKESMNRFYSVTNQVKVTAIDGQQYFDG